MSEASWVLGVGVIPLSVNYTSFGEKVVISGRFWRGLGDFGLAILDFGLGVRK